MTDSNVDGLKSDVTFKRIAGWNPSSFAARSNADICLIKEMVKASGLTTKASVFKY